MRALKPLVIAAIALFGCATACTRDTESHHEWPRTVEPRLTGATLWQRCQTSLVPGHAVPSAECGPNKASQMECDETIPNDAQAVRLLASPSPCADAAIAKLETLARIDPAALSDLAAAYYVRAQREDRASDLLRAFDAAQRALAAAPRSAAARFNLALIEEALGLSEDATASWNRFLEIDHSPWAADAREHLARLQRERESDAPLQWARVQPQLSTATPAAAARLVAPFQATAERYLEDELLPRWAAEPTQQHLNEAKTLASALTQLSGDRFAVDVVESAERAPKTVRGLIAFGKARRAYLAFAPTAAAALDDSARLLDLEGNPLSLVARASRANAVSRQLGSFDRARAMLDPIERKARDHSYKRLVAYTLTARANFLSQESRYTESLAESDVAIADYMKLRDEESVADARMRRRGVVDKTGQHELAWRDSIREINNASPLVSLQARHNAVGGLADAALTLGYAPVALLYENAAVRLIQGELSTTPPEELARIHDIQVNLGSALRARARIEINLEQYDRAAADLNESIRLGRRGNIDPGVQGSLRARIDEVSGKAFLRTNPRRAVAAFTEALHLAGDEFLTFRASLFAQRAEAQRRSGRTADAESDLEASLDALHHEEANILEHHERGKDEEFWSPYFSRFQETYQLLIRQLLEEGRNDKAFDYAERARAFEPLNLASRELAEKRATLAQIRQSLPPGTLLLEYSVLDDQTVTWLVSRESFKAVSQKTRSSDIQRWSNALQQAARARNRSDFETQLFALYDRLIALPLARFGSMPQRLVIVPDGPMHGLPFAALHDPKTGHYLIEDVPVEIAGSANLYLFSLRRDGELASNRDRSVLLIGDPAFSPQLAAAQGLPPLPHARSECERIAELYSPNVQLRMGRAATIPQFLALAHGSSIIHVAAHGIVNAQTPTQSFILFAPSPNDPGPLDAHALLTRLHVEHTRLVVLSACSSAGGLTIGAEGVAPLVRPLIGARVPGVIGALWNVDDATTEDLLVSFHRHYQEGKDAAVALQLAQVELLSKRKPGLQSALAWAPFQLIGHSSSPFAPRPQHKEKPP